MHDFQFYDRDALGALQAREHEFADKKNAIVAEIKELRTRGKRVEAQGDEEEAAARLEKEANAAWQFRFDWFFKSRNAAELQRRGDTLIRLVEKENEELETTGHGGKKRKSFSASEQTASSRKKKPSTPATTGKKQRRR
eukprot:g12197.t1